MRIVMPAIVPHTEKQRFLAMARFEAGESHPHHHGFTMGAGNPRLQRVRADVGDGGKGDVASDSDMNEVDGGDEMLKEGEERCGAETGPAGRETALPSRDAAAEVETGGVAEDAVPA